MDRAFTRMCSSFSALQRAEIAEIVQEPVTDTINVWVSVLFNEPKLLKFHPFQTSINELIRFSALQRAEIAEMRIEQSAIQCRAPRFSALQRAEIAEILLDDRGCAREQMFQCSSTSRNC